MPVTFTHLNDPQATQAQEPKAKLPADRAQESSFASLMQSVGKDKGPAKAASTPAPAPGSTSERIYKAVMTSSEKYNLSPALVLGFIKQESGFKPEARSWCGAQGLMQLMPGTAKQLGVTDSLNIEQNVEGGCKYIRQMLDQFGGDLKKAVAAYNAGPGAVQKYDGVPPFKETQAYVPAVLAHAEKFNNGAPIIAPSDSAITVVSASHKQTIDYRLVIDAIQTSDAMNQAALSLAITSNIKPMDLPESKRGNDDPPPPPPPPPRGIRV